MHTSKTVGVHTGNTSAEAEPKGEEKIMLSQDHVERADMLDPLLR